ncbi:MAG: TRAP transporter small permease [Bacteroidetes bacterium]|nr:TRAP transporter small permease [Bacteroidota bacterium]MCB0842059.1 TRAP transporter small permease [Bacteroidota bacterium]MCB0851035.1 TRAP transporter small permease [Bacteroidota bacterium]
MGIMVINVLWQVFSRYILKSPSSWTDELARFLLIWLGLLGAAYATGKKMHLAIDLLPMSLEGKKADRLNVVIQIIVLLFALFAMVLGGMRLVYITLILEQTSAAMSVPLWIVYLVIPISGILIVYYSILNMKKEA